ncbi:ABC multidrug transporter [Aspergillus rambellii]|uniref:ABC multidrug transporter n=1 Tax=Aspergillus rambellii TaxID=308745 RepID=A0A0F8UPR4_9EURO|nr:ABC multidrug transporter [Aspergillus rambellii]
MPAHIHHRLHGNAALVSSHSEEAADQEDRSLSQRVHLTHEDEDAIAEIHRTLTEKDTPYPEPHSSFDKFLEAELQAGKKKPNLGVCFQSLSTWGAGGEHTNVKTLATSLWRTLTFQDVYEWTIKSWISAPKPPQSGRQLIRDFTGVVRDGEIMLVLGRPGAGCSTFLRTIAGHHSSFLGVTGYIDYSGLSLDEVKNHYRGQVVYVPEDDLHFPTLNVRQTLEFALQSKTPKRYHERIPRYLEIYGRVFGMSHTMDTLVGNEYIRGVSGGERKRISIIESLATDSSVMCWDNSTRGLDASSALDYARSLRIMTDTCGKATLMTLYQASDAIYDLVDKVLLIDEGRMLYQGPAHEAKAYFEDLGYECAEMQTVSDFLTSITVPERRRFRPGWEKRAPKGPLELEEAFRNSPSFRKIQQDTQAYDDQRFGARSRSVSQTGSEHGSLEEFKKALQNDKSRFVSSKSPYTISLFRQVVLCARRQLWQIKGHMSPLYIKLISCVMYGILVGSMFYDQPQTTDGIYSRGGVLFYSAILLAWLQMSELEDAMQGRDILRRQKKLAFVSPSAVCLARVVSDLLIAAALTLLYVVVVYFLSGLKSNAGSFFIDFLFVYVCTICLTAQFRLFASVSPNFAVALRYCGISVLFCIVFGGYVLSVDKMMADVPWVGWIAYTTPALYTYESMMAAEFHNTNFTCAPASVVPSGPNYTDVTYQTCAYAGSQAGSTVVNGDEYLAVHYGFYFENVWRNFGILCLFTVFYIAATCWLSEVLEWEPDNAGPIQHKKSRKKSNSSAIDEEAAPVQADLTITDFTNSDQISRYTFSATQSTFTWDNLELSVKIGKEQRMLLNGVSGYCKPGTLTALVGTSGAGKSTCKSLLVLTRLFDANHAVLTALTQRQSPGELTGTMYVDGNPIDSSFNRRIGYCQQMDIHDESSTVREAFEFSALLRQGHDVPAAEKLTYARTVLETLDLIDLQDAVIGSLDIEKKKRVTIGVELCARPEMLLFLDEPTSGLDSQAASSIVALLRRLADQGLAILCTIHQANQQQFEQFDRVLALSPGGNTHYFGGVGPSGSLIFEYFSKHGYKPENVTNAADFLIEVVVGGMKTPASVNWSEIWRGSTEAAEVEREIAQIRSGSENLPSSRTEHTQNMPPLHQQIMLLTTRTLRQFWRNPEYPYSRLYASFLHAFINGLTYLQIGNSSTDLQSKAFSCFLVLMLVPEFINAISMRFIMNRDLWKAREGPSHVYGWVAFCTSQILSEIPYAITSAVVFFVVYYFMVGLPLGFAAGYSFLMFFLFFLFATSWGQWIAALSADSMVAATLMPFFIIMCELFNGILQPHNNMPAFWKYTMYYLSPFTYWIGGVLTSVLRGMPVVCNKNELTIFQSPPNMTCGEYAGAWLSEKGVGYLSNPEGSGECGYCEYTYGDDYLSKIGLNPSKIWPYFGIFTAFVISNYLMVYLLVYLRSVMKPVWRK